MNHKPWLLNKNKERRGKKYKQDKTACQHELFQDKDGTWHCGECFSVFKDNEALCR